MDQKDKDILLSNSWFSNLQENDIEAIFNKGKIRHIKDGVQLFQKKGSIEGFYGLIRGAIKICNRSFEGKEFVTTYLEPGAWFGEISLLDNQPRTHNAYASGAADIFVIAKPDLQALLEQRPHLYKDFTLLLCRRIRLLFSALDDKALLTLEQLLAKRLVELSFAHGSKTNDGIEISIHMSKEHLSFMLGSTRQSVHKILKKFESIDLIKSAYGKITVTNRDQLMEIYPEE